MNKIIAVEKIDLSSFLEQRTKEVNAYHLAQIEKRKERIVKLTPYIAQALFGMVEVHNHLIKNNSKITIFNNGFIEDIHSFVNDQINKESNWNFYEDISKKHYRNVSFKCSSLFIWLSTNYGSMKYTSNRIYQMILTAEGRVYYPYNVEEFLKKLIEMKIK